MSADQYHADPCPQPSLSSSIINVLRTESPQHAWWAHPKLNQQMAERDGATKLDIGSVIHKLVLEAGRDIAVLNFNDYRGGKAQEAREEARAAGLIPVLAHHHESAKLVAAPLQRAAEEITGMPISHCLREVVVLWQDGDVWKRSMMDLVTPDGLIILDLKSTEASVSPQSCERRIYEGGYHVQARHYTDGMDAVDPENIGRRKFVFLFGEQAAPYAVSPPITIAEDGMWLAQGQIERATATWKQCLSSGKWPAFGNREIQALPRPWLISEEQDRQLGENSEQKV